jgi:hypothetical protein
MTPLENVMEPSKTNPWVVKGCHVSSNKENTIP